MAINICDLDGDLEYCLQHNPQDGINADTIDWLVAEIVGENDSKPWYWVLRLVDGKFAGVVGSCDYTGWDCQSTANSGIFDNVGDAVNYCATADAWGSSGDTETIKNELLDQVATLKPIGGRMEHHQ